MIAAFRKTGFSLRLTQAALAAAFALACVCAGSPRAIAADESEEEPAESRFVKQLLGINEGSDINYRERSPLVVPPGRDLPPPVTNAVTDPAWPKDHDRKVKKKYDVRSSKGFEEDGRPLTPAQLDRGRKAGAGAGGQVGAVDDTGRKLSPSELGYKGGLFGSLFGNKSADESMVYPGEPPRTNLTEPPTGYMTPSPNYPYGLSEKKEAAKPYNLENKGTEN